MGKQRAELSETFDRVLQLVREGEVRVSDHGYDELAEDGLSVRDIVAGVSAGRVVEDYPTYPRGPCVLVLQSDSAGSPVHVVWGIPEGHASPAVLVTAYRPDLARWHDDFLRRR